MPEMDGIRTTKKIREMEKGLKTCSIIAITAHAQKVTGKIFIIRNGQYIAKPINFE